MLWQAASGRPVCSICYLLWEVISVRQVFLLYCVLLVLHLHLQVFVLHYEGVLLRILLLLLAFVSLLSLLLAWSF